MAVLKLVTQLPAGELLWLQMHGLLIFWEQQADQWQLVDQRIMLQQEGTGTSGCCSIQSILLKSTKETQLTVQNTAWLLMLYLFCRDVAVWGLVLHLKKSWMLWAQFMGHRSTCCARESLQNIKAFGWKTEAFGRIRFPFRDWPNLFPESLLILP